MALISDPEATFNLSEIDVPDDIIALLNKECNFQFDQESATRATSDMATRLAFLLNSHHWAADEIDSEAYTRMDMILQVLWRIGEDSGTHGPTPSYL